MPSEHFFIADREIGASAPCYVIAEIGSNHNNDINLAREHIQAAKEAGVDAVKFQTFKAANHYSIYSPVISEHAGKKNVRPFDLIKTLEMDRSWLAPLQEYATELGLHMFSSPCDKDAVQRLCNLDVPAYKVASFDLPDLDLMACIAKTQKPVILSTGLAHYEDIQRAVNTIEAAGNSNIILLQCTSLYPAPVQLSNLNAISTMRRAFGTCVGYSDHTLGDHICCAAVAMGAKVIEKHFTLDRNLEGPDHSFSIEPAELKSMVNKIRDIESALGDGIKNGPRPEEMENYEKATRSLHLARKLEQGQKIARDDLVIKRPGYGIKPSDIEKVIGMCVTRSVAQDHWLSWDDFK